MKSNHLVLSKEIFILLLQKVVKEKSK